MSEPARIVCPHCGALNRVPANRPARAARCGACHDALFTGQPLDVDAAGFERHMKDDSLPLLLDVWAPWCGPCRAMAPAYARAAALLEPDVRLLRLNADTAPDVAARLNVRGIPAMFLLQGGRVLAQTAGAMDTGAITAWVRRNLAAAPGRAA
ncbi:MAG: thioredoxin domain-containing protein [Rhodospirillales bacterium]|nr:thioredoxin domain-containing protein [Rhodospirillales bacterium]